MKICKVCQQNENQVKFEKNRVSMCSPCKSKKQIAKLKEDPAAYRKRMDYIMNFNRQSYKNKPEYQLYTKCLNNLNYNLNKIIEGKLDNDYVIALKNHLSTQFKASYGHDLDFNLHGSVYQIDHVISALRMARMGFDMDCINAFANIRMITTEENRKRDKQK